jgi:hypothetical protein
VLGHHELASGHAGEIAKPHSRAEAALADYAGAWSEIAPDGFGDYDRRTICRGFSGEFSTGSIIH